MTGNLFNFVNIFSYSNTALHSVVGWTAVPMSYDNLSLIEGKVKLPILRNEHSPAIQLFKVMEKTMANDLSNWICNLYLEVL
jgi:hypothetical protein